MASKPSLDISRRQFLAAGGLTVAAACITPRSLIAQTDGLVGGAFKEAAAAKVTVQNLRRNISVLLGAGGNIAVIVVNAAFLAAEDGRPLDMRHLAQATRAEYRKLDRELRLNWPGAV